MLEFYKTIDNVTKRIDSPEHGCWISAVCAHRRRNQLSDR